MTYKFKKTDLTPMVNLSAKMDNRTNNETLDGEDINQTGLIATYIQNADLFNSKAVSSRKGIEDVCGGIVNDISTPTLIFDVFVSGLTHGGSFVPNHIGTSVWKDASVPPAFTQINANVFISNRDMNVFSGNCWIREVEDNATYPNLKSTGQIDLPIDMRITISKLNQTSVPASGDSWFESSTGVLHNIALNGTVNYSGINTVNSNSSSTLFAIPEAVTETQIVFDNIVATSNGFYVDPPNSVAFPYRKVPFVFQSPVTLFSGSVYSISQQLSLHPSGTLQRFFDVVNTYNPTLDYDSRVRLFSVSGTSLVAPLTILPSPEKSYLGMDLYEYTSPNYATVDYYSSNENINSPLISGNAFMKHMRTYITPFTKPFTGTTTPPIPTDTVEFGEVITLPSGTYTVFGGYFFATPDKPKSHNTGPNPPTSIFAQMGSFTRNGMALNPVNYNLGYTCNLSRIDTHTGTIAVGDYKVVNKTLLSTYSGNYVFDEYDDYYWFNEYNPNYNLRQLNAIFNHPVTINITSPTDYLLSFKYYDFNTGGDFTDYSFINNFDGTVPPNQRSMGTEFRSFIRHGFQTQNLYSGTYVINSNNDGQTFISPSGSGFDSRHDDLACGLYTISSGNAITGIYDYRLTESRTQRIIYEQDNNMNYFTLQSPDKNTHVNLYSGATIDEDLKWTHATLQNLMFASQYSDSATNNPPKCWDQVFANPSGNSVMTHGLRPSFTVTEVSCSTSGLGFASGTSFDLMLTTEMISGGIRASEIQTVVISGTQSAIQISGTDIFNNVTPFNTEQYYFDIISPSGQSTYVWATQAKTNISGTSTGNVFYLAGMVNSPNADYVNSSGVAVGGSNYDNPLYNTDTFNSASGTFINDISSTILTQEIPAVVGFDQRYFTDQVDVPRIKKWIVYQNTLIGTGDPSFPCRLWISQILAPQIFGTDGVQCNFQDIDIDDGSPITGMEIFRDRLIVFKYNSYYVLTPTGDSSSPFLVQKMSNNIGCLGFFTTVSTDQGVLALSQFGPVLAGLTSIQTIGDEIIPYYSTLDHTDLTFAVAIHDVIRNQVYWSITSKPLSPDNDTGLIFNYKEQAWAIRNNGMWNAAGIIGDEDNFNLLFTGDVLGQIRQLDAGDVDYIFVTNTGFKTPKNIELILETPWLNFGNSEFLKQLKNLRVNCDNSEQKLKIDVYFDQDDLNKKYTRYLNCNVPVINRVVSLDGECRTCRFVITSTGNPDKIKLNSIQLAYKTLGNRTNI